MKRELMEILSFPKVKIEIINKNDDEEILNMYKHFTKRHPKYKIIKNKTIGVMLYQIPKTKEEYEKDISGKNGVGYFSRRCKKMGYTTKYFKQREELESLFKINTSSENRQGRKMSEQYFKEVQPEEEKDSVAYFGVYNSASILVRLYENCKN